MQNSKKVLLAIASVIGISALTACTPSNPVARTYMLDSQCQVYYVNDLGDRVYDGKYSGKDLVGLPMMQDANGRWYYVDSFGNRVYKAKRCW